MASNSKPKRNLNSTRLSMALLDLPLTPFGMKNSKLKVETSNARPSKNIFVYKIE